MHADRVVLAQAGRIAGETSPWVVSGGRALPLRHWSERLRLGRLPSVSALLGEWQRHEAELRALTTARETARVIRASGIDVRLLQVAAPVAPRQVFCTIGNYRGQLVQAAVDADDGPSGPLAAGRRAAALFDVRHRRETGAPYVCLTSPARVAAPYGRVRIAADTVDWEVEIAAVLGPDATIAGYCTANDLTVRSRVLRADVPGLGSDWVQSKGAAGTLPLGPWFVPAWQVPDVAALRLRLWVDDELMQDDLAGDMVFPVEEQLRYLAGHVALDAGDVICTGSPAGFGAHYGRYLRPGNVVSAEVTGLGRQVLTCEEAT